MSDETVYYLISDLHIGGDEQLEHVEFLDELLAFLERLEQTDENAELIINGDAFGLWEFTDLEGLEKFDSLVDSYPELFAQLRATGESVQITLVPGNHDYELAAYEEYVDRLAEYNVDLVQAESITRDVGDRTIWFEHGMQRDPNNRIRDFGNAYDTPLGYHVNRHVTSRAGKLSGSGRYNWLKDIQSVTSTTRIPVWMVSKYFYREMNPLLRYAALPFLFLFNVSLVLAVVTGLDLAGIWSGPSQAVDTVLGQLGPADSTLQLLLAVNVTIVGLLMLVAIPLSVFVWDARRTLRRFGVFETDKPVHPDEPYDQAARKVFSAHPETAVFCYGHTHRPDVREVDNRLVVNSGTWLKRLHRRDVLAGVVPPVFRPSFQLSYFRISAEGDDVVVEHDTIDKPDPVAEELTLTERLLIAGRHAPASVPDRSVVPSRPAENRDS